MEVCNITPQDEFRVAPLDIQGSVEILKEGRMFINTLPGGEIPCQDMGGLGFYYEDTRYLSCLEMKLNDTEPVFLSRTLRDSHLAQVEMTNKEFEYKGQLVPLQTVHIRLLRLVKDGYYERVRLVNFNQCDLELSLVFKLGADFADIFEVRGTHREERGVMEKALLAKQTATLTYLGKDNIRRSTVIGFHPAPADIWEEDEFVLARFNLKLKPKEKYYIYLKIKPVNQDEVPPKTIVPGDVGFTRTTQALIDDYDAWKSECLRISSDNESFNYMTRVAVTDLRALSTVYPGAGMVLEAGIPWYAAPFGRDALITAWQTLSVNPGLARETLRFMARFQGRQIDDWRDEQPGKILHELRFGEMARAGEIPHTPYYGSVDSTLWFIILLSEYIQWTGDEEFVNEMFGPLNLALEWCERYGDFDHDGYIEYQCRSRKGLVNQGWKDSWDGVIDRAGRLPEGPIALVEVQGYYYKALNAAAQFFEYAGQRARIRELRLKAEKLRQNFLRDFWLSDKNYMAYALDGHKNIVDTVVSNPGHCLFTGILTQQQAHHVVRRLMEPDMFSGWGIRTMSTEETAYNPMSYHNGSVWPHDNAIIGIGMREAGDVEYLQQLTESLFDASDFFTHRRLPELFCGFTREGKEGPVNYPIACDPQAWAVGSIFLLLRALLGIECFGAEIYIRNPCLPRFLQTLRLENLQAGRGKVALEFTRRQGKTYCGVVETEGDIKVVFE